ncbi:hypothetical protein BCR34DRAFT_595612 [Clohesyomyces aquaticus]|uniref:Uncharacterized protein n=1 Tax=Clohesyomyces aquaticus TaxID=1231657 RepID=A0A1Y2AA24_9PLEO|nr:hypothetical protein BCR34DRAFT_595612 [Clohesyomyces aquaticus]
MPAATVISIFTPPSLLSYGSAVVQNKYLHKKLSDEIPCGRLASWDIGALKAWECHFQDQLQMIEECLKETQKNFDQYVDFVVSEETKMMEDLTISSNKSDE